VTRISHQPGDNIGENYRGTASRENQAKVTIRPGPPWKTPAPFLTKAISAPILLAVRSTG
jgi:hypothetical protein